MSHFEHIVAAMLRTQAGPVRGVRPLLLDLDQRLTALELRADRLDGRVRSLERGSRA